MSRIYFVSAPSAALIKIGVTGDISHRLIALRSHSPVELVLLAHMPGTREDKFKLHRHLNRHRRHGEWFADSSAVRACIAEALEHPQDIPPRPIERTPKVNRALNEVMRLTLLDEAEALELLRRDRKIVNAIGRGEFRKAGALIEVAYRQGDKSAKVQTSEGTLEARKG